MACTELKPRQLFPLETVKLPYNALKKGFLTFRTVRGQGSPLQISIGHFAHASLRARGEIVPAGKETCFVRRSANAVQRNCNVKTK